MSMPLFKRRSATAPHAPSPPPEHAVLVRFAYGGSDLGPLFELEDRLREVLEAAHVGEYDGNEVASDGADGVLYMYGPDAEAVFAAVEPVLRDCDFMRAARVTLRFGPPGDGVAEREVTVGA
jgi:hypothetical protein